ncbi:MAG: nucleoside deaminase [Ignavibacteriales bacterium]|nr:MAG: nucleoside deaminase [Ignavibacteriales bacterium]
MLAAIRESQRAFDHNEVPVGAVIVYKDRIIAKGHNQVEMLKDPTAHAEMIAITSAATYLDNWRLSECDIYVTLEPCIMCTGALLAARVRSIFFSVFDPKFGACGSVQNLAENSKTNHRISVYSGLMMEESKSLLAHFFHSLRLRENQSGSEDSIRLN